MNWQQDYQDKLVSVEDAVKHIKSGDKIHLSPCVDAPQQMITALSERYNELEDVHIYSGIMSNLYNLLNGYNKGHLNYHCFFPSAIDRAFYDQGNVNLTSIHFSSVIPMLTKDIKPNVVMASVSAPDKRGFVYFGPAGAATCYPVCEVADKIIVQVNKKMPRIFGQRNSIHISRVDVICEADYDIVEIPPPTIDAVDKDIVPFIERLINDGDTLQIGVGGIGEALGVALENKNDLGVHTEMMVDSLIHLAKKGVITCNRKNLNHGKMVYGIAAGKKSLYEFLDDNSMVEARPFDYTNDVNVIAANNNIVSINFALEADLTGQICAESIGFRQISSTGGQLDFVRGASMSKGGRSFIALRSTLKTKSGLKSRINVSLNPGGVVTTPRSEVQYVVTEYGIVNLRNKSIAERIASMISIAHPDFRDQLKMEAKQTGLPL